MRIFDCFPFFNELDLLEIRLNELDPVVDRFVIAEANTTHKGKPKPLYYQENAHRYKSFANKITHIIVDTASIDTDSARTREYAQRNGLSQGIGDAHADDIVLLSDVDEIPMAYTIEALRREPPKRREVVCFEMRMTNFFTNLVSSETWLRRGPRATLYETLTSMEDLRSVGGPTKGRVRDLIRALKAWRGMRGPIRRRLVGDAGWHFSYLGGPAAIAEKMRSIADYDDAYLSSDVLDSNNLEARIAEGRAFSFEKSKLTYRDLDASFPAYLVANKERFAHLIADENKYKNRPGTNQA